MGLLVKRLTLYFFIGIFVLTGLTGCAETPADNVVARVNGKEVNRQELERFVRLVYLYMPDLQEVYGNKEHTPILEEEILWLLIEQIVLEQEVERLSLKLDETELEQSFRQLREDLIQLIYETEENYQDRLEELQLTDNNLRMFPRSTLMRELLYQYVNENVSEDDALQFVQENPYILEQPATVYAYRILLETKKEALEVLRLLQQGADFVETGEKYSREGFVELGQINETDLFDPLFVEAAFQLEPGEISEPVETPQGYYLIMITEKEEALTLDFEEVREDVMMILQEDNYEKYFHRLLRDSDIETFKENK